MTSGQISNRITLPPNWWHHIVVAASEVAAGAPVSHSPAASHAGKGLFLTYSGWRWRLYNLLLLFFFSQTENGCLGVTVIYVHLCLGAKFSSFIEIVIDPLVFLRSLSSHLLRSLS